MGRRVERSQLREPLCTGRRRLRPPFPSLQIRSRSFPRLACQVLHTVKALVETSHKVLRLCCVPLHPEGWTIENLCCRSQKLLRNVHVYLQQWICLECEAEGQLAQEADGRLRRPAEPLPGLWLKLWAHLGGAEGMAFFCSWSKDWGTEVVWTPKHGLLLLSHSVCTQASAALVRSVQSGNRDLGCFCKDSPTALLGLGRVNTQLCSRGHVRAL